MEQDFKFDQEARYETISRRIENFIFSDYNALDIQLHKDEIPKLEKEMDVIITRGKPSQSQKGMYWCTVFRKQIANNFKEVPFMGRNDITERLSRSEQNHQNIKSFLESENLSMVTYLYSSEISRLEKDFPQIEIEKGKLFQPRLYTCTVRRK